jgi:hypothetical protein
LLGGWGEGGQKKKKKNWVFFFFFFFFFEMSVSLEAKESKKTVLTMHEDGSVDYIDVNVRDERFLQAIADIDWSSNVADLASQIQDQDSEEENKENEKEEEKGKESIASSSSSMGDDVDNDDERESKNAVAAAAVVVQEEKLALSVLERLYEAKLETEKLMDFATIVQRRELIELCQMPNQATNEDMVTASRVAAVKLSTRSWSLLAKRFEQRCAVLGGIVERQKRCYGDLTQLCRSWRVEESGKRRQQALAKAVAGSAAPVPIYVDYGFSSAGSRFERSVGRCLVHQDAAGPLHARGHAKITLPRQAVDMHVELDVRRFAKNDDVADDDGDRRCRRDGKEIEQPKPVDSICYEAVGAERIHRLLLAAQRSHFDRELFETLSWEAAQQRHAADDGVCALESEISIAPRSCALQLSIKWSQRRSCLSASSTPSPSAPPANVDVDVDALLIALQRRLRVHHIRSRHRIRRAVAGHATLNSLAATAVAGGENLLSYAIALFKHMVACARLRAMLRRLGSLHRHSMRVEWHSTRRSTVAAFDVRYGTALRQVIYATVDVDTVWLSSGAPLASLERVEQLIVLRVGTQLIRDLTDEARALRLLPDAFRQSPDPLVLDIAQRHLAIEAVCEPSALGVRLALHSTSVAEATDQLDRRAAIERWQQLRGATPADKFRSMFAAKT